MNEETIITAIAYVYPSTYRKKVLKTLGEDNCLIPSVLAKKAGILQTHISKTLAELKEQGLIECINPEVRKGKLYRNTELGIEILKYI